MAKSAELRSRRGKLVAIHVESKVVRKELGVGEFGEEEGVGDQLIHFLPIRDFKTQTSLLTVINEHRARPHAGPILVKFDYYLKKYKTHVQYNYRIS